MKQNHRWMIDSMEEQTAAVEQDSGPVFQIPRFLLPVNVREGDICSVDAEPDGKGGSLIKISIDADATKAALQRSARQLQQKPGKADPGGPIIL